VWPVTVCESAELPFPIGKTVTSDVGATFESLITFRAAELLSGSNASGCAGTTGADEAAGTRVGVFIANGADMKSEVALLLVPLGRPFKLSFGKLSFARSAPGVALFGVG
jgi:hypothetical protein